MWANKRSRPRFIDRIYSFSRESFMADRTGLDSTILHYLAVQRAMVSIHRPIHSKITLTYSLTWQTDRCTLWLLRRYKTPRRPFSKLCSSVLCAYCLNKLPEQGPHGPIEARLSVLSIMQLRAWAHRRPCLRSIKSSLCSYLLSTLYVTHVIKYFRPSTAFPYSKQRKAGWGLGTKLRKLSKWLIRTTESTWPLDLQGLELGSLGPFTRVSVGSSFTLPFLACATV